MRALLVIRHGITTWNVEGRIQGQSDIALSDEARRSIPGWRLPAQAASGQWLTSPLNRARETAALLGHADARIDQRLQEMNWGDWEGQRLEDLRRELGEEMTRHEALGLDLRPPGGESPRDLQARVAPLLTELASEKGPFTAVTHKGIIRALYALAVGWDMTGKPPVKLHKGCCHLFQLSSDGQPEVERLNIPLISE
jgi:probable phosphoglycerate mutase